MGKKIGMTQVFTDDGRLIPVSVIEAGPCSVVQKKTLERDGYSAFQIGFLSKKAKKVTKPEQGHFKKAGVEPMKVLREVKPEKTEYYEVGKSVRVENILAEGDLVHVRGTSKGKGFAGVIKRHGFAGGPASHGSRFHRAPGAIGSCATPGRTFKNMKMAGQMGNHKVTVCNLEVVRIVAEKNILLLKGAVPGSNGGILTITKSRKNS